MITTVTTTTITTITTITTVAAMGLAAGITIAAVICLILFLGTKELAGAGVSTSSRRLAKFLDVSIIPLAIVFVVVVTVKIVELLA